MAVRCRYLQIPIYPVICSAKNEPHSPLTYLESNTSYFMKNTVTFEMYSLVGAGGRSAMLNLIPIKIQLKQIIIKSLLKFTSPVLGGNQYILAGLESPRRD